MSNGILTAAYGHSLYAEQAVTLACSYKSKGGKLPMALVCDEAVHDYLEKNQLSRFFDALILKSAHDLRQFRGKLVAALASPYERTYYFDADCLLVGHPDQVEEELAVTDFCVPGGIYTRGNYLNIDIKPWLQRRGISSIGIFNAGLFSFNQRGRAILEEALRLMDEPEKNELPLADGGYNEQVALGVAMAKAGIFPLYFYSDIQFSFFDAASRLELDLHRGICRFIKGKTWREPLVFHYTPLFTASHFAWPSRRILLHQIDRLRKEFGLHPIAFPEPVWWKRWAYYVSLRWLIAR
jgi:hypothetical protein